MVSTICPRQVALLFLAVPDGDLPHEAAWRSWFMGAEGLLPVTQMMQGGLPPQLGLCAKALANSRGSPIRRQWLFTACVLVERSRCTQEL